MPDRPVVLGYYADWDTGLLPQKIDYRLFTHITHSFASVGEDGSLTPPALSKSQDLCGRAHAAGTKVILALGGAGSGDSLSRVTATPDGVARLTDRLVAAVRQAKYDGVDVDWESPTDPTTRDRVSALVRALRERMPQGVITMAMPASDWSGRWFDGNALLPNVDFVNVMTYDFHGPWSNHAGHNAPLFYSSDENHPECRVNTVDAGMAYWLKQKNWPKKKVILGVPLYGRGFRAAKWGDPTRGEYTRSEVVYRDIARMQKEGWQRSWDTAAKVPSLQSPQGTEMISYEDAESARAKGAYARSQGLGGVFFWEISQDFDGTTNPLVRATRAGLG